MVSKEDQMNMKRMLFGILLTMTLTGARADACFDLYQLTDYQHAVEPGIEVDAAGNVPRHCVVRGVINRAIRFEVRLPLENWNGHFLMLGTGGSSGVIADTRGVLAMGFAASSTDTGHQGIGLEFAEQPEAALDYAFRGVHLVALTSKKIVQRITVRSASAVARYWWCGVGMTTPSDRVA